MSELIHILRSRGHYIGQIRMYGHQKWETVTDKRDTAENAMAQAVLSMTEDHKRARVLFIDDSGWYEPNIVMECKR